MDYSLDLGKVDPPIWRVMIDGSVYGPYTLGQLQSFAKEDRIRPRTFIARGDGSAFVAAEDIEALVSPLKQALKSRAGRRSVDKDGSHNYLIAFDFKSCGEEPLIREMNTMGFFAAILSGTYLLRSQMPLKAIKQRLNEIVQTSDSVFIVDATSNRFASINLPMESDLHVRDLWGKKLSQAA